jgi:anaerobic magnesium-protoporphyrin IX monomethyl ester cyclase
VALAHTPLFALRNGIKMLRHTFRGTSLRSILGLEDERKSFERYRALRRAERVYL